MKIKIPGCDFPLPEYFFDEKRGELSTAVSTYFSALKPEGDPSDPQVFRMLSLFAKHRRGEAQWTLAVFSLN